MKILCMCTFKVCGVCLQGVKKSIWVPESTETLGVIKSLSLHIKSEVITLIFMHPTTKV
jgi:hypothetical protein